jgi:hypothetical protein
MTLSGRPIVNPSYQFVKALIDGSLSFGWVKLLRREAASVNTTAPLEARRSQPGLSSE